MYYSIKAINNIFKNSLIILNHIILILSLNSCKDIEDSTAKTSDNSSSTIDLTQPFDTSISIKNKSEHYYWSYFFKVSIAAKDNVGVEDFCVKDSSYKPSLYNSCWTNITPVSNFYEEIDIILVTGSNTRYVYAWFRDAAGNISSRVNDSIYCPSIGACSNSISNDDTNDDTTAPSNVSNFTQVSGDSSVTLSWSNPLDSDFKEVKIFRTTIRLYSMPASNYQIYKGNKTSYTDSFLTNYESYYYYIYAFDESGNASSGKYLTATPFVPISTNDLQILQGSEVYGESTSYFDNDLVFLGTITGEYKSNSIFNSYGSHGSNYGSKSIWCSYCDYGSSYGSKSAFSTFALNPPVIYKNGVAVGYLTVNTSKSPRIDPRSLYLYKDEFY